MIHTKEEIQTTIEVFNKLKPFMKGWSISISSIKLEDDYIKGRYLKSGNWEQDYDHDSYEISINIFNKPMKIVELIRTLDDNIKSAERDLQYNQNTGKCISDEEKML